MKCPHCMKLNEPNLKICKHCQATLSPTPYYYPARRGFMKHEFTFYVEGEMIIINIEGRVKKIYVIKNKEKILESSYGLQKQIFSLEVSGHKILIRYNFFSSLLIPFLYGIEIYVDGKPLQGSATDPQAIVKTASMGFIGLINFVIVLTFLGGIKNYESMVVKAFFISMWFLMFLATPKAPLVTTFLGLLYCIPHLVEYIAFAYSPPKKLASGMFIVFAFGYAVITLCLTQGFLAAIKLRKMKTSISSRQRV